MQWTRSKSRDIKALQVHEEEEEVIGTLRPEVLAL
jgi:hypothetical protein